MNVKQDVFSAEAIVGRQTLMKGLFLNLVDPWLGGVLIRGEKSKAKLTAICALAKLIPGFQVVNLPISAREDRIVGTLDIEHVIREGEKWFESDLLDAVHGHILYVDEINLLDNVIVDALLEATTMGVNTVKWKGGHSHPTRFNLIGAMNPEEGDLPPQSLDRFALSVEVFDELYCSSHMEAVKRRLADPREFQRQYERVQSEIYELILHARERLTRMLPSERMLEWIAEIRIRLDVDGHRADIILLKTAMALAAFAGRTDVLPKDLAAGRFAGHATPDAQKTVRRWGGRDGDDSEAAWRTATEGHECLLRLPFTFSAPSSIRSGLITRLYKASCWPESRERKRRRLFLALSSCFRNIS
ncbi:MULTISPECIES: AAA family ATPase [Paenibacillus]|uniref:AAA family ATPase n=1 Tax=Paenibacillus TaxID=44249 RepID=UPI0021161BCA|nr:AAA family ATPase [Paenibacillus lautus]